MIKEPPKDLESKMEEISKLFNDFQKGLHTVIKMGRCKSLCQTKLEEAYFWAMQALTDPTVQEEKGPILQPVGPAKGDLKI